MNLCAQMQVMSAVVYAEGKCGSGALNHSVRRLLEEVAQGAEF